MGSASAEIWRVGAIMKEPPAEVLRFCAWYLELGAAEVVICFDDPQDPAIDLLRDQPNIRTIPCTEAYWHGLGISPEAPFVQRQNAALTAIYQSYADGWLLNVDADELLFFATHDMQTLLASVPDDMISARVATAERLLVAEPSGRTLFRLPMSYQQRHDIYGEDAVLFGPRREGFVGHSQGKSIIRCGVRRLSLRQHWPRWRRGEEPREVVVRRDSGAFLLHLIGEDYDVWRSKVRWRCESRGFTTSLTARIEAAMAEDDQEAALRNLYDRLHGATEPRLTRMQSEDVLLRVHLECQGLIEKHF